MFFPEDLTLIVGPNCDAEIRSLAKKGLLTLLEDPGHFLYDPRADLSVDRDLSESLTQDGIIQPIRIMRDGDRKLIVVGRQRVKAAALANSKIPDEAQRLRLPSLIYRADEAKAFKTLIVENEMRVSDPPCIRATKMQTALDRGLGEEETCRIFKVGKQQLHNMVKLLDCAPEVRKSVDDGEITATLAYTQLVKLDRKEQVATLKELKASGTTRGAAATEAAEEARNTRNPGSAPATSRRKAPKRTEIEGWIKKLAGYDDPQIVGVRMGLMKALGMSPKGWSEIKIVLESEE
jgi:ParB-like chromosome segregation protein Spo0J